MLGPTVSQRITSGTPTESRLSMMHPDSYLSCVAKSVSHRRFTYLPISLKNFNQLSFDSSAIVHDGGLQVPPVPAFAISLKQDQIPA